MKVFGSKGGAYDSDYMAAIEDAIVLGCDSCNLSLGSAVQGWTFDNRYQEFLNALADGSVNAGTLVSISAGNSSSMANNLGYDLFIDDVSEHTGGSPGTFLSSLCVASADNTGETGMPLVFFDKNVSLLSKKAIQPFVRNEQKQKRFITDASHELKAPLAVISANMDVLALKDPENSWIDSTRNQVASMRTYYEMAL